MTTIAPSARMSPWRELNAHRLIISGQRLTRDQVLATSDLGWTVEKSPIFTDVPNPDGVTRHNLDRYVVTVRRDPDGTTTPLGIVGRDFAVVQNETMIDTMLTVADIADAEFDSLGAVREGAMVFAALNLNDDIQIGGRDMVGWTLLGRNCHDGSGSFSLSATPTRIACTNALRVTISRAKHTVSLRHTRHLDVRIADIRTALNLTFKYRQEWADWAESLLQDPMDRSEFASLVNRLVPTPEAAAPDSSRAVGYARRTREQIVSLWQSSTQDGIRGTRWAAVNAIAEYDEWARPVRGGDSPGMARAARTIEKGNGKMTETAVRMLTR